MSSASDVEGNVNSSIISGEFETRESSAPGFETRGNNSMLGNDRGLNQDPYVNGHLPSYTDIRPRGNSVATVTRVLGTTEYGSGPGFDDIGPKNTSEPGLGSHTTTYNKPPEHSANLHENTSATANTTTPMTSVDPHDYVGISLVGKKFKVVNPDAYYVEKNEN
ncbi:hypothetical protein CTI12_AA297790 [Artemisia annua]|uniref:Uncharacterized protein n=1 Tax=Artemisia annua TaxID=35608 RepID=A0A2U1N7G1_ARTAN|nr:hypothetical protein CTI12_AA297790 [Artemisia annua]